MPKATHCFTCGASSLGIAMDGRAYCHLCIDWKHERWKAQQERERLRNESMKLLIPPPASFRIPIELLLSDEDLEVGLG